MKTKIWALALAATALVTNSYAQDGTTFGLRAGVNFQNVNGKDFEGDKIEDNKLKTGFHIGVNAEIPVAPEFYIQPGVLFSTKGAKDDANATSGRRTPSRKSDSAADAVSNNGGTAVLNAKAKEKLSGGEKVAVALDARISSGNNAELKGLSGEHVVAGWPSWLINVAPKAVEGWLPRRADSFEKLAKVNYRVNNFLTACKLLE